MAGSEADYLQAFLTGTLQNYARRNTVAIDTISYGFKVQASFSYRLCKINENELTISMSSEGL